MKNNKNKNVLKNKDLGQAGTNTKRGVPLNLSNKGGKQVHTNPNGKVVEVKVITDEIYFSKRKKSFEKSRGCSWMFSNYLEYNGWLHCNGLVEVSVEELDDKWS